MSERNEPPICARCDEEYSLEWGLDPTKYCHQCAHIVVDELEAQLAAANATIARLSAPKVSNPKPKQRKPRIVCDGCSLHAPDHKLPAGWCQCGLSRFRGVKQASWCPECTARAAWEDGSTRFARPSRTEAQKVSE